MSDNILKPEDYKEPACLLCDEPFGAEPEVRPIPQQRVMQKVDEYMSRRDYAGVERTLLYWLDEAQLGHDRRGELMLRNELIGHYRKVGDKEHAMEQIDAALALLPELHFEDSVSAGTTYTNAATACNAFEENDRAIELFQRAKSVYESSTRTDPKLLGGLYNNMALTLTALGRFDEAWSLYDHAMNVMGKVPAGALEQAITYLNMADLHYTQTGSGLIDDTIEDCLEKAWQLLDGDGFPRDGYYAFVCEKCAPTFDWYSEEERAAELNRRAEEIYERT